MIPSIGPRNGTEIFGSGATLWIWASYSISATAVLSVQNALKPSATASPLCIPTEFTAPASFIVNALSALHILYS